MKKTGQEFIRFVIIGIINTVNYYAVYMLLHQLLLFSYMPAHLTAFAVSLVGSFFLNSYITFQVKPTLKKFLQFPLTQIVNFMVTSVILYILVERFHISSALAPLFAMFIAVPATFIVTAKILKKRSAAA